MSAERPWLKSYPKGVPAEIDVNEYTSIPAILLSACARFNQRPDPRPEAQEGRSRRPDAAERAAVPGRDLRRAARRPDRGQHQSDVHRARAQAPAGGFRRHRPSWCSTTSPPRWPRCSRKRRSSTSSPPASATCSASRRRDREFRAQARQEGHSGISHRGRDPFNEALTRAHGQGLPAIDIQHEDIAFLQYTGGTTGVSPRARC
jgi:hypothetical protein